MIDGEKILTPQQELFLKCFLDPKSDTFGNYKQSALRAKYSEHTSDNISVNMPDWLRNALGKSRRLAKAEQNLDNALEGLLDDPEKGKKEIQWDASKMVMKTIGKEDYSERQELVGKDGKDLIPPSLSPEHQEKLAKLLDNDSPSSEK